ncbi:MAG TPA: tetratricopeptide repeat protein, partial [Planctomycetota bacterium]|nr:tetratricopeptide repeat protein [Planctomycetota bacterium]
MRGASHGAMRRARAAAWLLAATLAAGTAGAAGCGRSDGGAGSGAQGGAPGGAGGAAISTAEADTLRARSEAQFAESNYEQAYEILQPLLAVPAPTVEDYVRGGVLLLARDKTDEAAALVERAVAAHPDDPAVLFLHANVLRRQLDFAGAAELYRRVLATTPDDNAVKWLLAEALDAGGQTEEPLAIWKGMRAQGFAKAGPFYLGAIYRLGGDLIQHGQTAEGLALREESKRLQQETKVKAIDVTDAEKRGPGRMQPVRHESLVAAPAPALPTPAPGPAAGVPQFHVGPVVDLHGATRLVVADVDADGRVDLVGGGAGGLWVAKQDDAGGFRPQVVVEQPVVDVAAADLDAGDAGSASDPADPKARLHHPALELLAVADSGDG